MLRRSVSTVREHTKFWNTVFRPVAMSSSCSVEHDVSNQRFIVHLEDGENAVIDYRWVNNSVVDLYHTEVPPLHRGKGIAQLLAKAALDFVVAKDARMVLSCSYVEKFVRDNPLPQYSSRICKLQSRT